MTDDPRFNQALEKLTSVIVPLNADLFRQQMIRFTLLLEAKKVPALTVEESGVLKSEAREIIGRYVHSKIENDNEKRSGLIAAITDFNKVIPPKLVIK